MCGRDRWVLLLLLTSMISLLYSRAESPSDEWSNGHKDENRKLPRLSNFRQSWRSPVGLQTKTSRLSLDLPHPFTEPERYQQDPDLQSKDDTTESPPLNDDLDTAYVEESDNDEWGLAPHGVLGGDEDQGGPTLQSPLVYRYYGRSRARTHTAGSIPFILLGPNVDHWKITGQELATRGFSVIACERVSPKEDEDAIETQYASAEKDGAVLIVELMDALRWNKAVLVASDSESVTAIQAAMQLAPDRIVGLVLCGNMKESEDFLSNVDVRNRRIPGGFVVDRFLQQNLECPFKVVWDGSGQVPQMPSGIQTVFDTTSEATLGSNRCLIIGGGAAPHRRRPKLFAWTLTRFVEEKIAPSVSMSKSPSSRNGRQRDDYTRKTRQMKTHLPFNLEDYFSPGSMVVIGRIIATALFYGTVMKVTFYQYENIRDGVETVGSVRKKIVGFVMAFLSKLGSLFFRGHKTAGDAQATDEIVSAPPEKEVDANATIVDEEEEEESSHGGDSSDERKADEERPMYRPMFLLDQVIA